MQFSLYGVEYESVDNGLDGFIELLNDDDTTALYVAYDKQQSDDYDSIVLVNPKTRTLFPMFLLTFNESVEEYYGDLRDSFPDHAVIESNCTDFAVCDSYTIDALRNVVKGSFVSYTTQDKILVISLSSDFEFEPFGSKKIVAKLPKANPTSKLIQVSGPKINNTNNQEATTSSHTVHTPTLRVNKPIQETRVQDKPVEIQKPTPVPKDEPKVAAPIFVIDDDEEPIVKTPEPKPIPKPVYREPVQRSKPIETPIATKKVPSQKNLYSYCKYNENTLVIHLLQNNELAFIDRKTGYINRIKLQSLLENDMIGYDNETDIIRQFGKIPMIPHMTKSVLLVDIRQVIKFLEPRKESPVTKQIIAYDNGILYVAIPSADALNESQSIKNFTINCHKKSIELYEVLKAKTQSYSKTLYCLITMDGVAVAAVGAKGDFKVLSAEQVFACMPELNNVADIIRLFPIDKIIDGSAIALASPANVNGFSSIPTKSILLSANQYVAKNIIYSYDSKSKMVLFAPKPSDI